MYIIMSESCSVSSKMLGFFLSSQRVHSVKVGVAKRKNGSATSLHGGLEPLCSACCTSTKNVEEFSSY